MQQTKLVGFAGERSAAQYLESRGYSIIHNNYTIHHVGEIDIIARKNEFLVCVEVKTRYNKAVPFEALIPKTKQRKIIKTARYYVQEHCLFELVVRFDALFVDLSGEKESIVHIENAFQYDR